MKKFTCALILCTSFLWNLPLHAQCNSNINGFVFIGEFEDHFYYTSTETSQWENASSIAATNGGYLASITSQAENDFLQSVIDEIVFIGFNDIATNGNFEWDSNEGVGFNNLATTNSSDLFYGNMNFWNGEWSLDGTYVARKFLLEIECSGTGCPDADNDGTCDDDDCEPNNPAFPASPGTSCDDANNNTTNDVIQSDGCSCLGTPTTSGCNVSVTSANGELTITGLPSDANSKLFDPNITSIFECNTWSGNQCSAIETVSGLTIGDTYFLSVQSTFCNEWIPVTIQGNGTGGGSIQLQCEANKEAFTSIFTGNYYELDYTELIGAISSNCVANVADLLFISNNPEYAQGTLLAAGSYNLSVELNDRCGNKTTCDFDLDVIQPAPATGLPDISTNNTIFSNPNIYTSTYRPGQIDEITFDIVNTGEQIFEPVQVDIYLSETDSSLTNATLVGTYERQGLSVAGTQGFGTYSTVEGSTIIEIPENTAPGDYYLVFSADPNNDIAEGDETNNLASEEIKVLGGTSIGNYCAFDLFFPNVVSGNPYTRVDFEVSPAGQSVAIKNTLETDLGYTNYGRVYDVFGNSSGWLILFGSSSSRFFSNYAYGYSITEFYGPSRFILDVEGYSSQVPNNTGGIAFTAADADIEEMIDIQVVEAIDHLLIYGVYLTTSDTYRSFLIKRMLHGGVVWQQIQDESPSIFEFDFFEQSETGNYYFQKTENDTTAAIQQFDTQGNLAWNRDVANDFTFVGERNNNSQLIYSQNNNGILELFALNTTTGTEDFSINLASTLSSGQVTSGQSVDGVLITDFGFVVSATANNTSTYAKLDQDGSVIWTADFPSGKTKAEPQFITTDGGIVFGKIADDDSGVMAFYVNDIGQFEPECIEPPSPYICNDDIDGYEFLGVYNDSYYFLTDEISTPNTARYQASLVDGFLAQVDNQEENDFIQSVINELVYIGMTDRLVEGQPKWTDLLASIFYQNFDGNTNTPENDFVVMQPWNGKWAYSNYLTERRAVMEIPCTLLKPAPPINLSSNKNNLLNDWTISPNPAYHNISININLDQSIDTTIEIINASGQVVIRQSQVLVEGFNRVELSVDDLPSGMYFIRIPEIYNELQRFVKAK